MKGINNFQKRSQIKAEKKTERLLMPCDIRDSLNDEIEFIQGDTIKYFAKWLVTIAPEYFFYVTCSKSGDYHPKTTNTKHGLLKHTKYCMRLFNSMADNELMFQLSRWQKDIILVSLLAHDFCKRGVSNGEGTFKNFMKHGAICANHIRYMGENSKDIRIREFIKSDDFKLIYNCIYYHNGNFVKYTKEPIWTREMVIVHQIDYIASNKTLDYISNLYKEGGNEDE